MKKAEAIELLRELSNFVATPPETDEAINMAIEALQTDIVRCKDCKWYENACTFFAADPFERAPMEKNDFCSYGERRIENLTVKLSKEQPKQDDN